jgi:hypothetical protein
VAAHQGHADATYGACRFLIAFFLSFLVGYMNIAMEQTEEYSSDGQLMAKYGDCFIRGNNGE